MVVCESLFSDYNANKSIWLVVVFPNIYLYWWFLFGFKKSIICQFELGNGENNHRKISFYILPTKLKIPNVKLQLVDLFWQWQLDLYGTEVIYNFWRRNNHFKLWRAFGLERKAHPSRTYIFNFIISRFMATKFCTQTTTPDGSVFTTFCTFWCVSMCVLCKHWINSNGAKCSKSSCSTCMYEARGIHNIRKLTHLDYFVRVIQVIANTNRLI